MFSRMPKREMAAGQHDCDVIATRDEFLQKVSRGLTRLYKCGNFSRLVQTAQLEQANQMVFNSQVLWVDSFNFHCEQLNC